LKRAFAAEGKAIVLEVEEPELRPGEVLIQTSFSVVSTGTNSTRRSHPLPHAPHPDHPALGYSASGTVVVVADDVLD
jgi:NADPH:quinone reductase-like Zn-dependent oxidoreductase